MRRRPGHGGDVSSPLTRRPAAAVRARSPARPGRGRRAGVAGVSATCQGSPGRGLLHALLVQQHLHLVRRLGADRQPVTDAADIQHGLRLGIPRHRVVVARAPRSDARRAVFANPMAQMRKNGRWRRPIAFIRIRTTRVLLSNKPSYRGFWIPNSHFRYQEPGSTILISISGSIYRSSSPIERGNSPRAPVRRDERPPGSERAIRPTTTHSLGNDHSGRLRSSRRRLALLLLSLFPELFLLLGSQPLPGPDLLGHDRGERVGGGRPSQAAQGPDLVHHRHRAICLTTAAIASNCLTRPDTSAGSTPLPAAIRRRLRDVDQVGVAPLRRPSCCRSSPGSASSPRRRPSRSGRSASGSCRGSCS